MPDPQIKEIHTHSDDAENFYYLGCILDHGPAWTLVQVIAEDCSLGSLMLIKNTEITEILSASPNIDFVRQEMKLHGVLDPMRLKPYVDDIVKGGLHTLTGALNYSLSMRQSIVIATKTGEELVGYVSGYNHKELRLTQIDYYEKVVANYDTVIPLTDVVTIHLFNEETCLMDAYFANASDMNFSGNLVELYMNFNDDRDSWPWVGVIAAKDDQYYLFERINQVGCLSSLQLINRRFVYYVAGESSNLNYYRFIVALKQQMGLFDPSKIEDRLQDLRSIPTFYETLASKKKEGLFTVNNQAYDAPDTGILTKYDRYGFQMSLINNLEFLNDLEDFRFDQTITMTIWSQKTATMSSILKSRGQD